MKIANLYDPDSELCRLNRSASTASFKCSESLYSLLKKCRKAWIHSEGAFDISAKKLMDIWGFYRKRQNKMPAPQEIRNVLQKTGLEKVIFDDNERTVFFTVKGMALDLGGIAKGWTVDNMAKNFENKNISATPDIGGNLRIINPAGRKSIIGIRDPRFPEKIERKITISSRSCSSSGGYERFVRYNNKHYAHIMDPSTGYPAEKCLAVTVITDSAPDADRMSTAVFIRGKELAEKLVKKYPGTTVYIYLPGNEKKVLLIQ